MSPESVANVQTPNLSTRYFAVDTVTRTRGEPEMVYAELIVLEPPLPEGLADLEDADAPPDPRWKPWHEENDRFRFHEEYRIRVATRHLLRPGQIIQADFSVVDGPIPWEPESGSEDW